MATTTNPTEPGPGEPVQDPVTRFEELAALLHEAVYEADGLGRLVFMNDHALKEMRYTRDEISQGLSIFQMVAPSGLGRAKASFGLVMEGRTIETEHLLQRKDGSCFLGFFKSAPIRRNGAVIGIRGAMINLSEHRGNFERPPHLEKLENLGRVALGVAHDVKNLLTPILMLSELLERKLQAGFPLHRQVGMLRTEAQKACLHIHQLLNYGRRQVFDFQPVDLAQLVEGLRPMFHLILRENITCVFNLEPGTLIRGDPMQLQLALMNLVMNAQDAMPEGGVLTLSVHPETLRGTALPETDGNTHGRILVVEVRDTGVGMGKMELEHLFEPFFTTKKPGKGTGLGLAMVHDIVKQHEGTIEVHSGTGKGTAFRISLPGSSAQGECKKDVTHSTTYR